MKKEENYIDRALRAAAAAFDSGYVFGGVEELQVIIEHHPGCAALSDTDIGTCTCAPLIQLAGVGVKYNVDLAGDPHIVIVGEQPAVVH